MTLFKQDYYLFLEMEKKKMPLCEIFFCSSDIGGGSLFYTNFVVQLSSLPDL
jgi:hypothetical protein